MFKGIRDWWAKRHIRRAMRDIKYLPMPITDIFILKVDPNLLTTQQIDYFKSEFQRVFYENGHPNVKLIVMSNDMELIPVGMDSTEAFLRLSGQ